MFGEAYKDGTAGTVESMLASLNCSSATPSEDLSELLPVHPGSPTVRILSTPPVSPPIASPASLPSPPRQGIELNPNEIGNAEIGDETLQRASHQIAMCTIDPQRNAEAVVQPLISRRSESCRQPDTVILRLPNNFNGGQIDFDVEPCQVKRQTPSETKGKKGKRKLAIEAATQDSDLFDKELSLSNVATVLDTDPTFSSIQLLRQFKVYSFASRPKVPIAYELSKLLAAKPVWKIKDLTRVLPAELLRRCQGKTTALQNKRTGLAEKDIALEIHGAGVFDGNTLRVMRRWHDAISAMNLVDKTSAWTKTIDFSVDVPGSFMVTVDDRLDERIMQLDPLSSDIELLCLAAKGTLGDKVMQTTTARLFGENPVVVALDCMLFGYVVNGITTTDMSKIEKVYFGLSNEKILIPLNCNGNHWCAIMIDLSLEIPTTTP